MGMTPAVALTTQSLEPMQAFAENEVSITGTASWNSTDNKYVLSIASLTYDPNGYTLGSATLTPQAADTDKYVTTGNITIPSQTADNGVYKLTVGQSYTAEVTFAVADENDSTTQPVKAEGIITITKADPTVTITPGSLKVTGDTLDATAAAKALNDASGIASVPGEFSVAANGVTDGDSNTVKNVSYTFTPTDTTNYNVVTGSTTITLEPAPVVDTKVDIDTVKATTAVAFNTNGVKPVYNGSPWAPTATLTIINNGNAATLDVPATAIEWAEKDNASNKVLKNAGTYTASINLGADGIAASDGTIYTGTLTPTTEFVIAQKELTFTQPDFFTTNETEGNVTTAIQNGVSGVIAGDKIVDAYTVAITSGITNGATVAPTPVVGTVTATGNYTFANGATVNFNVPVQRVVKIAGVNYAVSFKATKALNELSTSPFVYSYNGVAQAPEVVLTNIADPTQTATSGYTVLYGEGTTTNGNTTYVQGNSTKPTAVGKYQVTIQIGAATTPIEVGTYEIAPADITDPRQVAVTWNGQPLFKDGKQAVQTVSLNNMNQWSSALSVVYPSSKQVVEYNKAYAVAVNETAGSESLTISSPVAGVTNPVLQTASYTFGVDVAYYRVANVALAPSFKAPTYDGEAQELNKDTDLIVTDSVGNKISSANFNVTYTNNTNAGTATVTVTGTGDYAGQASTTFTIAKCPVTDLDLTAEYAATIYNAQAQTPYVTVDGVGLDNPEKVTAVDNKSKIFTVSYSNNTNASTATNLAKATITAAATSNYTGSADVAFKINPFDLSNANASTEAANVAYSATASSYPANIIKLVSGLEDAQKAPIAMTEGTDYEVRQNVATKGSTTARPWSTFTMDPEVDPEKEVFYTIVGQGNYTGSIAGSYFVATTPIKDLIKSVSVDNPYFNGEYQKPLATITLKDPNAAPILSTDKNSGLVVTYANNRNASKNAEVIITASGEVNGTAYYGAAQTYNFEIKKADLAGASFGIVAPQGGGDYEYTGSQIKPAVATDIKQTAILSDITPANAAKAGYIVTTEGTEIPFSAIANEYSVSYGANTNVTDTTAKTNFGTVTVSAASSNMSNSATEQFVIEPAEITLDDIQAAAYGILKEQADGATYAEPDIIVTVGGRTLVRNVDYILTVEHASTVGTPGQWTITGKGNYVAAQGCTGTFAVVDDIASATVTLPEESYVYDGTAKKPVPVVTYKSGNQTTVLPATAYTVSYENNINAGTAYVVITANVDPKNPTATFGGTVKVPFTIAQAQGELAITGAVADYTYTGAAATPEPNFTFTMGTTVYNKADLVAGTDYKYVYANNIDATAVTGKKATVTVQMLGNYGAKTPVAKEFTIAQANVASANVVVSDVTVGKTPKVAVTMGDRALTEGKDYTFSADTKTPGTKTATITGKGNYTGTQKVTFTVLNENQVPADDANLEGGTWKKTNGVWQYTTKDGKLVSSGWAKINGQYYYFDSKGNAKTGWLDDNGTWYYLNKAGEGTECAMVSNAWKKINGNWYHFAKSGAMQTGWQKINGAWYYLNKKGEGTEGAMRTGWQKINGAWYYLNKAGQGTEGAMKTGWFNDNGTWYYLLTAAEGTEGKMVSNQWKQINGSWFYFYAGGAMAANTWVGNYYVDANGYWVR